MTAASANQRKHSMGSVADKIAKKILTSSRSPLTGANPAELGAGTPAHSDGHQLPGPREGDGRGRSSGSRWSCTALRHARPRPNGISLTIHCHFLKAAHLHIGLFDPFRSFYVPV